MNYSKIITEIYEEVKSGKPEGSVASYIPELSNVNPDKFGIALLTVDGNEFIWRFTPRRSAVRSWQ